MRRVETVRVTAAKDKPRTWPEYVGLEKYALAIYRLQNEAGLTFKEARAVLTPDEADEELREEWGCSIENVYNLARKGWAKLDKYADGDGLKKLKLAPCDLWLVL